VGGAALVPGGGAREARNPARGGQGRRRDLRDAAAFGVGGGGAEGVVTGVDDDELAQVVPPGVLLRDGADHFGDEVGGLGFQCGGRLAEVAGRGPQLRGQLGEEGIEPLDRRAQVALVACERLAGVPADAGQMHQQAVEVGVSAGQGLRDQRGAADELAELLMAAGQAGGDRVQVGEDRSQLRVAYPQHVQRGRGQLAQTCQMIDKRVDGGPLTGDAAAELLDQDLELLAGSGVQAGQELVEVDRGHRLLARDDRAAGQGWGPRGRCELDVLAGQQRRVADRGDGAAVQWPVPAADAHRDQCLVRADGDPGHLADLCPGDQHVGARGHPVGVGEGGRQDVVAARRPAQAQVERQPGAEVDADGGHDHGQHHRQQDGGGTMGVSLGQRHQPPPPEQDADGENVPVSGPASWGSTRSM
jgi:hypothetical protein